METSTCLSEKKFLKIIEANSLVVVFPLLPVIAMILGFIFLIKNDAIFCKAVLVFSTSIICSLFIFGLELITKEAPFLKASSIKSFPSNLSPIIAINISSFFNVLVSIEKLPTKSALSNFLPVNFPFIVEISCLMDIGINGLLNLYLKEQPVYQRMGFLPLLFLENFHVPFQQSVIYLFS